MSGCFRRILSEPLALLALLVCAAHAVLAIVSGPIEPGSLPSNLLQMTASVLAAWLCFRASRRSHGFDRTMWTLVATGFAIWSVTQGLYSFQRSWPGAAGAQLSGTEFLFRLYRAPWVLALLISPDEEAEAGPNWQQLLDFAQVTILFLFFYFSLYFVPGFAQWLMPIGVLGFLELSDLENWSLLAAFLARAQLSRRPKEGELYRRFVPYLLSYAIASSLSNYAYAFWSGTAGVWPDLPFTVSLTVGGLLAASWPQRTPAAEPGPPLPVVYWTPAILPLLIMALAFSVAQVAPLVAFLVTFLSFSVFGTRLIISLYRQKRLFEALRSSEAQYSTLVQMAPDAIFVHVGGRVTFANPAAARILGVPNAQDLVGRHLLEFMPPERRDEEGKAVAGAGESRLARRWTAMRADGVRVPLDAVGMVLGPAGDQATPPARLVMARDVTSLAQAESEREALIKTLETKNAELERFTYTASHALRSPLITINGFLRHIEDAATRGDGDAVRADLERIRKAAQKMDTLLRDLLELSRIGHVTAPAETVPFEALCAEALEAVRGRLQKGDVTVEIEPNLPSVHGDRTRLIEALQNLLDNAAKFMGAQTAPRISIGVVDRLGESVFYVKDNGIGIDPRHQQAIFGLFDKLDPKAEGTGIGLALAKRIIELHGGRLWVESEGQGKGATFLFTLPSAPVPPTPPPGPGSAPALERR